MSPKPYATASLDTWWRRGLGPEPSAAHAPTGEGAALEGRAGIPHQIGVAEVGAGLGRASRMPRCIGEQAQEKCSRA